VASARSKRILRKRNDHGIPAASMSIDGNHTQSPSNGTNYPMITAAKALEDLDGLGLDAEARALFLGGNAVRVFDSLRKPGCLASRRSQRTSAEGGAPPGQYSPGHATPAPKGNAIGDAAVAVH
jgi:hypothetical protein